MSKENPVSHYDFDGISPLEIFKVLEKKDTMTNYEAFCRFNAIKYIWRYPQKNGKDDLEKARDYIRLLIEEKYPENKTYLDYAIEHILQASMLLYNNNYHENTVKSAFKTILKILGESKEIKEKI